MVVSKKVLSLFLVLFLGCVQNNASGKSNLTLNIDFYDLCLVAGQYPGNPYLEADLNGAYTEDSFKALIRKAAASGFSRIMFRVSGNGDVVYQSKTKEWNSWEAAGNPGLAKVLKVYNPFRTAVQTGHEEGLEVYAWVTPFDDDRSIVSREHPEMAMESYDGTDHTQGLHCFAYPEVKEHLLNNYQEVLSYGVDGLFLSDRTHSNLIATKQIYGWNAPVKDRYQELYGKPLSNAWVAAEVFMGNSGFDEFSKTVGSFYTDFLIDLKAKCQEQGAKLAVKCSWNSKDRISGRLTALNKHFFQWQRWVDDGIVDELVIGGDTANSGDNAFILAYYDVTAESIVPEYYRTQIQEPVLISRWLTLFSWGWPEGPELTVPGINPRSFNSDTIAQMLNTLSTTSLDGVYIHEVLNIVVHDQWNVFEQFFAQP